MKKKKKFIPQQPLKTAVLFLVFNRPDKTKQVFETIRQAKPPRLYIAADGAREGKDGESEKIEAVRNLIMDNIDWDCTVKTLFREKNLGCKYAVSEAITWFFDNEEMGIVLEDDCVPSQSFFWFCEELLEYYKDNKKIWLISGNNFQDGKKWGDGSYFFSSYCHIWGWACWANRWKLYDAEMKFFENDSFIDSIFDNKKVRNYWKEIFDLMKNNRIDTWDYQWQFAMWLHNCSAITPNLNLVSNIGWGDGATHTRKEDSPMANRRRFELADIKHPTKIEVNKMADMYSARRQLIRTSFLIKVAERIIRLFY